MQLSQPGNLPYSAYPVGFAMQPNSSIAVVSFQVVDAAGNYHAGLATDGTTAQQTLDIAVDAASLPSDLMGLLRPVLQKLLLAEFGGDVGAMMQAFIGQQIRWQ